MTESNSSTPQPTKRQLGFAGKPLVEKLKLIALFALIGLLIYRSEPIAKLFWPGAILTAIGALIRVWAGGHLTRDRRLAVSGPYQYTRNPFYLGRFCVLIGFALMSGLQNPFVWAIFLFGMAFFFFGYMPRKEKREGGRLEQLFGDQFRQYRQSVPSLFPRLSPYKDPFTPETRRWSRELFFGGTGEFSGNKELPTTLVTFVLIGLFLMRMLTQR
ncbi:Protein-S-isoprenylcysteine O-methyltransferase Ste14 [Abditibacterium utsteinense]|uniref:Protein-S-isoprenylcysteine O-methyltransferase Ste14 n=1 Tax=Abditibacterium utsteinense TaxID=1960156 RepID=A0A2S8SS57_9BACT|nr:isoprenylcysteine carboxylmethyltransferase family protein [Abditibacterium utsteinense]PQV63641.1 Protein-S-isoprenylcysteine O-methyltransferase Ste14 [Abditibacterium utsteinense]